MILSIGWSSWNTILFSFKNEQTCTIINMGFPFIYMASISTIWFVMLAMFAISDYDAGVWSLPAYSRIAIHSSPNATLQNEKRVTNGGMAIGDVYVSSPNPRSCNDALHDSHIHSTLAHCLPQTENCRQSSSPCVW